MFAPFVVSCNKTSLSSSSQTSKELSSALECTKHQLRSVTFKAKAIALCHNYFSFFLPHDYWNLENCVCHCAAIGRETILNFLAVFFISIVHYFKNVHGLLSFGTLKKDHIRWLEGLLLHSVFCENPLPPVYFCFQICDDWSSSEPHQCTWNIELCRLCCS